ncbi:MAG TPA: tetratricopeptide repeat protein [Planctomycetaceae bacterium]|nr:tetratricopeptide repeat protein [Planctomycetaceae bacterium]
MTSLKFQFRKSFISAMVAFLTVATLNAGMAFAVDQVTRRSDRVTFRGELTSMTVESLTVTLSNSQTQVVPVSDVFSVRFDMEPPLLAQAQSNERSGSLDVALEKFISVQMDYNGGDKRVISDVEFLIARTKVKMALADPSKVEDALAAIRKFREAHKTNFRYFESLLLESSLAKGDEATALLTEVQACPVKGYQLQAGVQLGHVLLAANDTAGASAAFDKVIEQSAGDASSAAAQFAGLLGKAECQQKQGQLDEAIATLDDIISKASESESRTLAAAWVLKGDCLRIKNLPKDALMAYLHVDVLYSSEPAAHAEALYHLVSLWAPAGHQDRADEASAKLSMKYPNSPWAKQAIAIPPTPANTP